MASTPTPGLIDIWHVAFRVADLDRSIAFYCGRLGFDLIGRDDESAFVSLGRGGFTLEFLAPPADQPTDPRRAPDHVAFESTDLDAYRETLMQSGLLVPEIRVFDGGMKRFALADPDGPRLDFVQGRAGFEVFIAAATPAKGR
jgi:catechol 2,3-dioxygenase-like lactoylglutathione lyase family enzyme